MLSGRLISPLSASKKDMEIIEKLIMNTLSDSTLKTVNIPEYILECFKLWTQRKEEIVIGFYNLPEEHQLLTELIIDRVVGVDDDGNMNGEETLNGINVLKLRIFKMFTNLKKVYLYTRYRGSNNLHYPFSM